MDGIERAVRVQPDNHRLLPQHVKRALAYMNANIAERVTLAGLASACAVPERTLLRQFQRFIGLPPLTYLRRLRLNAVRNELATAQSNDDISDVAVRCGFCISDALPKNIADCSGKHHPRRGSVCTNEKLAMLWPRTAAHRAPVTIRLHRFPRWDARGRRC